MMSTELSDPPSEMSLEQPSRENKLTEQIGNSVEPTLIQIHASKSQIERRIEAFMQRKQIQVDDANIRLFCGSRHPDGDYNCARVDAVYGLARINGSSHIKVSRVVNCHGPRLHPFTSPVKRDTGGSTQRGNEASDVQERLNNLETHLKITPDTGGAMSTGRMPAEVYKRLQALEERILEMESSSPEYAQCFLPSTSERKQVGPLTAGDGSTKQNMDISEIDKRILSLRQNLQRKKTM